MSPLALGDGGRAWRILLRHGNTVFDRHLSLTVRRVVFGVMNSVARKEIWRWVCHVSEDRNTIDSSRHREVVGNERADEFAWREVELHSLDLFDVVRFTVQTSGELLVLLSRLRPRFSQPREGRAWLLDSEPRFHHSLKFAMVCPSALPMAFVFRRSWLRFRFR